MLRGGAPDDGSQPLAKSPRKPRSREQAEDIREAAGLPDDFRHEMLSTQLAERFCNPEFSLEDRELLLHLIASHHGHARPFAPVCEDNAPPAVKANPCRRARRSFQRGTPNHSSAAPPRLRHDRPFLGSSPAAYGWWGLAYHEAILRLADWYASEHPDDQSKDSAQP